MIADNYFKEVDGVERQKIQSKYEQLVEWLMFLQMMPNPKVKDPQNPTKEEDVRQVINAYTTYMKLAGSIDKQTQELDQYRFNLNNDLRSKIETFKTETAELKAKISSF